jgi:hypothetical protein
VFVQQIDIALIGPKTVEDLKSLKAAAQLRLQAEGDSKSLSHLTLRGEQFEPHA